MDHSPFEKIPRELRNQIYQLVLHHECPSQLVIAPRWKIAGLKPTHYEMRVKSPRRAFHPVALAQICRKMRKESKAFFYPDIEFTFPISLRLPPVRSPDGAVKSKYAITGLCGWLRNQTLETMQALGGIKLDVGEWPLKHRSAGIAQSIAQAIREFRDGLSFLIPMNIPLSLRLLVRSPSPVLIRLPLDDRATLRTVVSETMKTYFDRKSPAQMAGPVHFGNGGLANRQLLEACKYALEELVSAVLRES